MLTASPWSKEETVAALGDARRRTLELVADLDERELVVPQHKELSPFLWELGRVAWQFERLVLRRRGEIPVRTDAERRFGDALPHGERWVTAFTRRADATQYLERVGQRVLADLERFGLDDDDRHFLQLAITLEDESAETLVELRQAIGAKPPPAGTSRDNAPGRGPCPGDAAVAGGPMLLGAEPLARFVRDREKWAHTVDLQPFRIARAPVTVAEFAEFVADGGYERGEFWSDAGWRWRQRVNATLPLYWRGDGRMGYERRDFDRWRPLEPDRPMVHVNAHEADAFCRFSGRELPTEAEWEFAASWMLRVKRPFPWGWDPNAPHFANLDGRRNGPVDVNAFPGGDSVHGCRQMLGNVWEWTTSPARPYPGAARSSDEEHKPWEKLRVARGGSFATRARFLTTTTRGFFDAERRESFVGFRTVAR